MNKVTRMIVPLMTTLSCHRSMKQKSKSTNGFTLIESVAALGCLAVFTILLISAWHTGWDTSDDKEQARALKLLELANERSNEPRAPSPILGNPSATKEAGEKK
jgi:hypothetical protein